MAYYSGTVNNFDDLKTAIETNCVANGWTLTTSVLSKNGCFFKLTSSNSSGFKFLRLDGGTGQSGSTLTGGAPGGHGVMVSECNGHPITFPINYELHIFTNPDEVYCVVNYNSTYYQQMSFGKSDVPGIGGTGGWFTSAKQSNQNIVDASPYSTKVFFNSVSVGYLSTDAHDGFHIGLFCGQDGSYSSSFIHADLDGLKWYGSANSGDFYSGFRTISALLQMQPNLSNQTEILLPIKPLARRSANGLTILASLKNARYVRIDNLSPGEIKIIGPDKWKCYPLHRKDTTQRNGVSWATGATHSGTFGYAIRYTGP